MEERDTENDRTVCMSEGANNGGNDGKRRGEEHGGGRGKAGGVEVGVVEEALTVAVVAEGAEGGQPGNRRKGDAQSDDKRSSDANNAKSGNSSQPKKHISSAPPAPEAKVNSDENNNSLGKKCPPRQKEAKQTHARAITKNVATTIKIARKRTENLDQRMPTLAI